MYRKIEAAQLSGRQTQQLSYDLILIQQKVDFQKHLAPAGTKQNNRRRSRLFQGRRSELKPRRTGDWMDARLPFSDCPLNARIWTEIQMVFLWVNHLGTFEASAVLMFENWHCECWNIQLELNKKGLGSTAWCLKEGVEQWLSSWVLCCQQQKYHPGTCTNSISSEWFGAHSENVRGLLTQKHLQCKHFIAVIPVRY